MKRHELIVIGAGPAGLSAAIEAKKNGMDVIVFDENQRPGGQLFKQIHKFFGSKEHHAKERGFRIGQDLLKEAEELGVRVELDSTVMGIYPNKEVTVKQYGVVDHYKGDAIIIATGAAENMIPFKGWDTPGVIGAGAPFAYESANLISAYRTAAIPGAGVKNLAKEDAKVLGIVGPGVINSITVETFAALRPSLDTLKIKGRGRASIDRCIAYVKEKCPQFKNIEVVDTIEDCVKGSDIMSFATSTPTGGHENYPYVKREWIKPGALICAPGAIDTDEDLITDFFQESAKKDICLHPDAGFAGAGREQKHLVGVGESLLDQKTPLAAGTKHHFHGKIIERHIGVQSNESRRNCIMFGKRKHDNFRAGSILKTAYQRRDSVPGLPGFFEGFQPGGSIGESRGEDKAEERNVLPHQKGVKGELTVKQGARPLYTGTGGSISQSASASGR